MLHIKIPKGRLNANNILSLMLLKVVGEFDFIIKLVDTECTDDITKDVLKHLHSKNKEDVFLTGNLSSPGTILEIVERFKKTPIWDRDDKLYLKVSLLVDEVNSKRDVKDGFVNTIDSLNYNEDLYHVDQFNSFNKALKYTQYIIEQYINLNSGMFYKTLNSESIINNNTLNNPEFEKDMLSAMERQLVKDSKVINVSDIRFIILDKLTAITYDNAFEEKCDILIRWENDAWVTIIQNVERVKNKYDIVDMTISDAFISLNIDDNGMIKDIKIPIPN